MESAKSGVSRRSFVAGAGAVAAAVAVAGQSSGARAAEGAASEGTANAVSEFGLEYPWAAEPPEITSDQIEEELDCDVAVVGLGVAGVAAFRAAAEAGAKVIGIEKADTPSVRSSQYCYINGTMTDVLGLGTVDIDEVVEHEWEDSDKVASYPIIRKFCYNEADVFDWWIAGDDTFVTPTAGSVVSMAPTISSSEGDSSSSDGEAGGMPMMNDGTQSIMPMVDLSVDYLNENMGLYPTRISVSNHTQLVNANLQKGEDAGGVAYFGHYAEQLIMEGGTCVGVYARDSDTGKYKKVNAAKGVIMSCGGCGSNKDMITVLYPTMAENGNLSAWPNLDHEGKPTNTGDGYPMGFWAGAAFSQSRCAMTHVMGGPNDVANMDTSSGLTTPHLRLNYNGKRFMNEDCNCSDCELLMDREPKRKAFLIFDAHLDEQMGDCIVDFPTTPADMDAKVDGETVFKADTLEGLFDAIVAYDPDFNKENALESVERYNQMCANGYDEDFNKQKKYLYPVQDGPFYAERFGIGLCLTTMGGLSSDEDAHVISTERKIIPGLYCAGNIQGDRFAVKYPFKLSGASHAMAMYYGYVAGKNAAQGV
ncbi:MAG: FAD-binding protein [Coriobacteriales bacterium]|jgi:succinate dehydrogenase/fumarate reductase flavoprotein subunit